MRASAQEPVLLLAHIVLYRIICIILYSTNCCALFYMQVRLFYSKFPLTSWHELTRASFQHTVLIPCCLTLLVVKVIVYFVRPIKREPGISCL